MLHLPFVPSLPLSPVHSPSSEARIRLDFSDTFSQTFTRQLPLPPPPPPPLPRSYTIKRLSGVCPVTFHCPFVLYTLRRDGTRSK